MKREGNRFFFVGNGAYTNRGCEAIVRGTVKILKRSFGDVECSNAFYDHGAGDYVPADLRSLVKNRIITTSSFKRFSANWAIHHFLDKFSPGILSERMFEQLNDDVETCRAVLSLGGDNYSLDYGVPKKFIYIDKYVKRHKKPLVIWGASIGPFEKRISISKQIIKHLKNEVYAIFVREKKSFVYLKEHGVEKNVFLTSDPAFVMDATIPYEHTVYERKLSNNAIGFNFSPLMAKHVTKGNMEAWVKLAGEILKGVQKHYDNPIVLIPHVTNPGNNDYEFMHALLDADKNIGDCYLLSGDITAPELKWVISKLSCLVAARTHATIASFSSCIPTISMAYSTKAYGINHQIMGSTEYVIDPDNLCAKSVVDRIRRVFENEKGIKDKLSVTIPRIQEMAYQSGESLRQILSQLSS